jgi:cytochrome c oxidase subunit 3
VAQRTLSHARFSRLQINRIGLWLFIASESMVFVALLVARFSLQGTFRPDELNQQIGLVITSILLVSSLTAYRAEARIASGDTKSFLRYTLATIVLGFVFLVGVAFEWSQALVHFPPTTGFGTVFFTMTGMHAFHVITGLIALLLLYVNGRRGTYSWEDYWGAEGVVKYWHFVDVVWVFFYPALYLVS